jgi:hypothetical protein
MVVAWGAFINETNIMYVFTYQSRVHGSTNANHACCFWLSPIFWTAASNWSSYFICFFLMHLEYWCRWICCGKGKAAKLCSPGFNWLQGTYFYELNKSICIYLDVVNPEGKVRRSFTLCRMLIDMEAWWGFILLLLNKSQHLCCFASLFSASK